MMLKSQARARMG